MLRNSNDSIMSWKVYHNIIRSCVEDVLVSSMVSIWDLGRVRRVSEPIRGNSTLYLM